MGVAVHATRAAVASLGGGGRRVAREISSMHPKEEELAVFSFPALHFGVYFSKFHVSVRLSAWVSFQFILYCLG